MNVDDALEDVLQDCRRRLEAITLSVPDLDSAAAPRPSSYFSPPPGKPAPVKPPPKPASAPTPAPAPAPMPTPAPAARGFPDFPAEMEEPEYFPPTPRPTPAPAAAPRPEPPAASLAARSRWTGPLALAAAAAFVLAALGVWSGRRAGGERRFELNDAPAFAFRPDKRMLLVARPPDVFEYALDGTIVGRSDLAARSASLSWNEGSLWSVDGESPEAVEARAGARQVVFRLNHVPSAVFAKDDAVWTVDKGGRAVHQYLVSRSILGALIQPLDLVELPDLAPEAIAVDGEGVLWALDAETRALYRFRADKGVYRRLSSAPLSPVLGPDASARGMALDGDGIWFLTAPGGPGGTALVRRVRLDRLKWSSN